MKNMLIILGLFLFTVSCGEKTDTVTDKDAATEDVDETLDEAEDIVDTDESDMSDHSEMSDDDVDEIENTDLQDTVDESSDEVADEIVDEMVDESLDEEMDETQDDDIDEGSEVPLSGFGEITGECGFLDTELTDEGAHYFKNKIDFATDPYDQSDYIYLTDGGKAIYDEGNLGGSSIYSEVFAYEVLNRCEFALLLKTESVIDYQNGGGKKTDFLVNIDDYKVGVSVTRALKYPFDAEYTVSDAESLLNDKLSDILLSSANVAASDSWEKQILHVIAYSDQHAQSLATAYSLLDSAVKADTVVIVTVSDGDDGFLY